MRMCEFGRQINQHDWLHVCLNESMLIEKTM